MKSNLIALKSPVLDTQILEEVSNTSMLIQELDKQIELSRDLRQSLANLGKVWDNLLEAQTLLLQQIQENQA